MKKITMEQIKEALNESRTGSGKVHIVVSQGQVDTWVNSASISNIKASGVDYIHTIYSDVPFSENENSFSEKHGYMEGNLAEMINNYLVEQGYELED